jgi:hypothetical protein
VTDYPFTTDGCSGGMSRAWRILFRKPPPWESHCITHDRAYHPGGTRQERRAADDALKAAVTHDGYPVWAFIIWAGVRVGGHPLLPFSWRWGYGWKYSRLRGYRPKDLP